MKLAPGLHRIGSDVVNSYLVEEAAGITIVDAGLPGHWRELEQELTQLGRSLDDVRGIVLTHGDTDHIGFAERLRQGNGIGVRVHELDAARARGEVKKPNSGWGRIKVRPLLGFLWYSARHGGLRIPPVREVMTFADGAQPGTRHGIAAASTPRSHPEGRCAELVQIKALDVTNDITETRWLAFLNTRASIPLPFVVVLTFWLTAIFGCLAIFAPRNSNASSHWGSLRALVASAVFLIIEMDQPFGGFIGVPATLAERRWINSASRERQHPIGGSKQP